MAQLSDKARENLLNMKKWREEKSESNFIKIPSGTSKVLLFDTEDMTTEVVEFENNGVKRKSTRAKYGCFDISEKRTDKQYFTAGKNASNAIDGNLEEGNICLKLSRSGEGFDTRYTVVSVQIPPDYNSPL